MNVTYCAGCLLAAQANAAAMPKTFIRWVYETLGRETAAAILLAGLAVFVAACIVVARSRRPAVIAACLVLLPLPLMIGLCRALASQISSLSVLSVAVPAIELSGPQIAAGVAAGLLPLLLALVVIWPSYLVLAIGLIVRAVHS